MIQSWYASHQLPVPACDTSSYCRARQRIDHGFLEDIHERITSHLSQQSTHAQQWNGFDLYALDASSVHLLDTPENQSVFPNHQAKLPDAEHPSWGFAAWSILAMEVGKHASRHRTRITKANPPSLY